MNPQLDMEAAMGHYRDLVAQHGLSERDIHAILLGALGEAMVHNEAKFYGHGERGRDASDRLFEEMRQWLTAGGFTGENIALFAVQGAMLAIYSAEPMSTEDRIAWGNRPR